MLSLLQMLALQNTWWSVRPLSVQWWNANPNPNPDPIP